MNADSDERCRCGGQFVSAVAVVPVMRCASCRRELPATAITGARER